MSSSLADVIRDLQYPPTPEAFELWKQETLARIGAAPAADKPRKRLSPREEEVMKLLLEGRRLKDIAHRLQISVKTVTTHRARLLAKLGLEDNLGLYRYGVRAGLIDV